MNGAKNRSDIAVVGMACLFPGMEDLHRYWARLLEGSGMDDKTGQGASARGSSPADRLRYPQARDSAGIQYGPEGDLPGRIVEAALRDAGMRTDDAALHPIDLILTRSRTTDTAGSDIVEGASLPVIQGRVPSGLNLVGDYSDAGEPGTSFLSAIVYGVQRLRQGACSVMIVAALSGGGGAGAVVMKRRMDAESCNDPIYAFLKGGAAGGHESGARGVPLESEKEAILRAACADAGIEPETICFLEAHGARPGRGQYPALGVLKALYGGRGKYRLPCPVGAACELIGEAMGATGMASFIKTVLCISNKVIPPGAVDGKSHPGTRNTPFYTNAEAYPWIHNSLVHPRRAAVDAFGSDGTYVHVILEEVVEGESRACARPVFVPPTRESELVVLAAESIEDMKLQLHRMKELVTLQGDTQLAHIALTQYRLFRAEKPMRLAIVCKNIGQLHHYLTLCSSRLDVDPIGLDDQKDIYFTTDATYKPGKITCIFPGLTFPGLMGSYSEHLRELCLHFPHVRAIFDSADQCPDRDTGPIPTSHYFFPPELLSDEERASLHQRLEVPKISDNRKSLEVPSPFLPSFGMAIADWACWSILTELSVPVDMVFGHSVGELAALCAAEALEFDELIKGYWVLDDYYKKHVDESYLGNCGRLAFVNCTEEQLKPLLDSSPSLMVAVYIAPKMQMLGGEKDRLEQVLRQLGAQKILGQLLPYPAIHTSLAAPMESAWSPVMDGLTIHCPRIPVYSAALADTFPESPSEIRKVLRKNAVSPLKLWQASQKMYQDGARIFIQLGGGDTLYSQAKANIGSGDIIAVATDVDFHSPVTQLNHLCGMLLTNGTTLDLDCLFRNRFPSEPQPARISRESVRQVHRWTPPGEEMEVADDPLPSIPEPESAGMREDRDLHPLSHERFMPFVRVVAHYEPGLEILVEHVLDVHRDFYLRDHMFVHAPEIKPLSASRPVLPMAFGVEMMAEVAACLAPGHGLIGIENATASKWIALEDTDTLRLQVSAKLVENDPASSLCRIQANVFIQDQEKPAMSATILMGKHYLLYLNMEFEELLSPHPYPLTPQQVYSERHLFHGPRFQCISDNLVVGDQGITGDLVILPAERLFQSTSNPDLLTNPCFVDGVIQLVALWAMHKEMYALPIGIGKLELYRPTPPAGTQVPVRAQIDYLSPRMLHARIEAQDGQGSVWFRISELKCWIYRWPRNVSDFKRLPARYPLTTEMALPSLPPGAVCRFISRGALGDFDFGTAARFFLHMDEMETYGSLEGHPTRQRQWLLGRIAAKDAVRLWLARGNPHEMLHPAAFTLRNDSKGCPFVEDIPGFGRLPRLSIAHSEDRALAVAHGDLVGIDMERIAERDPSFIRTITTPYERDLLGRLPASETDEWVTRLWCSKEAAGKLLGTGMNGAPQSLEAVRMDGSGSIKIIHTDSDRALVVSTIRSEEFIVALAAGSSDSS